MINNNWLVWALRLSLVGSLLSCADSTDKDDSLTLEEQNEFVHLAMQDRYYWYQNIPSTVSYGAFSSPNTLVKSLRKMPEDSYSYVTTVKQYDNYYKDGQYVGFGFGYSVDSNNRAFITFVYNDSPINRAGIKRGDEIISVDGIPIANFVVLSSGNRYLSNAFGASEIGVSKEFVIKPANLSQKPVSITKALVTKNTVLSAKSFNQNGNQYAYLAFKSFINPSYAELETAFSQFKKDGAQKLILDLRYNGGGLISVASALASYIYLPNNNNTDLFTLLKFNDKHQGDNTSYYLKRLQNSLGLNEVIILSTDSTCSASELVINALEPYIDVTVIGSTTCGKPIGMRAQTFGAHKLVAINFQTFNSANFGDYFNGISVDCVAEDDVSFALGNVNEAMLKAALDYDANPAQCVAPPAPKVKQQGINKAPSFYQGLQSEHLSE